MGGDGVQHKADLKDKAGNRVYFFPCQQIPQKDKDLQYVSLSLNTFRLPQPVCGTQTQAPVVPL